MNLLRKSLLLFALMFASTISAQLLRPTVKLAAHLPPIDLEDSIPKTFGEWRAELNPSGLVVNPQQTELLSKLYTHTLSRSYLNNKTGQRVMLSIAYGDDQRDSIQLHYPEVCYPAQGFQVLSESSWAT